MSWPFDPIWLLRGLMGVVLVIGSIISYYSLSNYRRTRSRPMLLFAVGFMLVSLAAALAGIVYEVVTHDLLSAEIVSAGLTAVGFGAILYSLRMRAE